jgi:predicted nucleic-acid-binding protein
VPYVDANVILRYLTDEPAEQAEAATRVFARAVGGVEALVVDEVTIAEVVWTLKSLYRTPRSDITATLLGFLSTDGLVCQNRSSVNRALILFDEKNIDFTDALLCARMLEAGETEVYSFDRHVDRVPGIRRLAPA